MTERSGLGRKDTLSSRDGESVGPLWTHEDTLHAMIIIILVMLVICSGCVHGDPVAADEIEAERACTLAAATIVITDSDAVVVDSLRYLCRRGPR